MPKKFGLADNALFSVGGMSDSLSLTAQLRHFSGDNREMAEAVLRQVLPELRRIATRELGREKKSAPLTPTELIHETWLRNLRKGGFLITTREHFYGIAARAMRHVLIDFARARRTLRRGDASTPFSPNHELPTRAAPSGGQELLIEIGILMAALEKRNAKTARIVDLHYFAGFTLEEIAGITGLTFRQVRHRWEAGRDWLKDGLRTYA